MTHPTTPTARLEIHKGGVALPDLLLNHEKYTLGRAPDNRLCLGEDVAISRFHAEIVWNLGNYVLTDVGSSAGTFLNDSKLQPHTPHPLNSGDRIKLGGMFELVFRWDQPDRPDPPDQKPLAAAPKSTLVMPEGMVMPKSAGISAISILRNQPKLTIGRDVSNTVVIEHPAVSRFHAQIRLEQGNYLITDLDSTNGTFVNGQPIAASEKLSVGDLIRIGASNFTFEQNETLIRTDDQGNLRLDALHLNKEVGGGLKLLRDISFTIRPREFVVIAGVSGGGKSTLLDALTGFRPATSGTVLVNGIDLYTNFKAYRNNVGYVPQKDIVHMELTVAQSLDYAARLRMPADTTRSERKTRIDEVLAELGLNHRRDIPVKNLSGGQLKRVSIGVELLTRPNLFFLDEATSGLDPGTEADIMQLLRSLASQGRTVILITHATDNLTLCDLVIFLAAGGRVAYIGSPAEAPAYFGVQKFNEIYRKVERERTPEDWQQDYLRSPQYQKYVLDRQANLKKLSQPAQRHRPPERSKIKPVSIWRQFLILSERNLAILIRDRPSLMLMFAIALILGVIDFFSWKHEIFDIERGDGSQTIIFLFTASLISVMVGSLSTMREIIKEVDIYRRERMIGLMSLPYIFSKIWFVLILASYLAGVSLIFKLLVVELPGSLLDIYITLLLATIAGMIMGLFVSAISPNQNVAPLLTIIFLVPQVIFGGGILPANEFTAPGRFINNFMLTKWPFEALVTITGVGTDVAEDPCWQKSAAERNKLTEAEKNQQCTCMGPQLFSQCNFPGLKADYDESARYAVEKTAPVQPEPPGEFPEDPAQLKDYMETTKIYNQEMEVWQNTFSTWKEKRATAISRAEELLNRFNKQYGSAFKVDVFKDWGIIISLILFMFAGIIVAQKYKDLI
jgi:ABC transport system ATP-binding/permease protein